MRSKRFEALAKRPVNQDGFVKEWIEEGFIAMESPNDPKPSIKIVNGVVTELDGKPASQFDLIDHFMNCTPNVGHNLTSEGAVYETFI